MSGEMNIPVLDSAAGPAGAVLSWTIETLDYSQDWTGTGGGMTPHWVRVEVTACELVVIGGALVVRNRDGEAIVSWGPGTWGEVRRGKVEKNAGRHS